jgi:hypothetical protein
VIALCALLALPAIADTIVIYRPALARIFTALGPVAWRLMP